MLRKIPLVIIEAYQRYLRAALPCACRFWPSCSEYAKQAIQRYGVFWGGWKTARRILRCHPFCRQAGYDPLT